MDAFIVSSLFPAIVALENGLRIRPNEVTWEFAGKETSSKSSSVI